MPPLNILFVDDDSDESYLFNEALEACGLNINLTRAYNGNQLFSVLHEQPTPDLVIMDINMPYKDGIEALVEIRSNTAFKNLPVIIYSTTKNVNSIDLCYKNGASLFVVKPNDFEGMVQVVSKVLTMNWQQHNTPNREDFVVTIEESVE